MLDILVELFPDPPPDSVLETSERAEFREAARAMVGTLDRWVPDGVLKDRAIDELQRAYILGVAHAPFPGEQR